MKSTVREVLKIHKNSYIMSLLDGILGCVFVFLRGFLVLFLYKYSLGMSKYRRGCLDWQLDLLNSYRSVTICKYNRFTNPYTLQYTRTYI
jgi:hypothetical protein